MKYSSQERRSQGKLRTKFDSFVALLEHSQLASSPNSWTPIFINAEAVVLEIGGPLQHGAIIAREYGIPCVSGVENATKAINDGDLLEVDGTNGVVKILEKDS